MRSIVRRMVESKDSFSPEEDECFEGLCTKGSDFKSVGTALVGAGSVPRSSPRTALSRSSGFRPCFSMFLVNASTSLPILDMSSADAVDTLGSGFRFPSAEDISDARRAMKASSDSAESGFMREGAAIGVFPDDEGLPGPDEEGVGCCDWTLS